MSNNLKERRAQELLNTQTSVEETTESRGNYSNKNTELVHREKIEGTPFYIIGNEDEGYFVAMGKYRLTEPEETVTAAMDKLITNQWDIILKMVLTSHELVISNIEELAGKQENRK